MEHKKVILYPGGFKPFHDGHFKLLINALDNNLDIDALIIFIGKKQRDYITGEKTYEFILTYVAPFIEYHYGIPVYCILSDNPIKDCFNKIDQDIDGYTYTILSSDKSADDKKRCDMFYEYYKVGGKFNTGKWNYDKVFKLNNTNSKVYFNNNLSEYCEISGTYIRNYFMNNMLNIAFDGFKYMICNGVVSSHDILEYYAIH